jgi:hypothetical protein
LEKFLSSEYGLAGICVLLTIQILVKVGEFVWSLQRKRQRHSDAKLLKLENDLKRAFFVLKTLAGPERWPSIREEFTKEFPF